MSIRYILGLDLETANLETEPDKNRILEVGAVLYDAQELMPLNIHSWLIKPYNGVPIDPDGYKKHRITDEMLHAAGVELSSVVVPSLHQPVIPDAFMAHNGTDFDEQVLMEHLPELLARVPWIDTRYDVPFDKDMKTRNLTHMAAEHGFLNPFAHRAGTDVLTMLRIASLYSFDYMIESMQSPLMDVIALVSYDNRNKAKDVGFYWDGDRKQWWKRMRKIRYNPQDYNFKTALQQPADRK